MTSKMSIEQRNLRTDKKLPYWNGELCSDHEYVTYRHINGNILMTKYENSRTGDIFVEKAAVLPGTFIKNGNFILAAYRGAVIATGMYKNGVNMSG